MHLIRENGNVYTLGLEKEVVEGINIDIAGS